MRSISRRQALSAGAALGLGVAGAGRLLTTGTASAAPDSSAAQGGGQQVAEETRSLDELYQAAKAEGGKLVVYAGGDVASQQAGVVAAFKAQFPDIALTMVVDYSKFHDVRIDNQFATGQLIPDVAHLQTLQDFTRWKQEGRLLHYKPAGFSKVHDAFKDPDGAWVAISVIAFSFMYNSATLTGTPPKNPEQLVDSRFKGLIASSYPNDDDAVLYLYSLYAQTYGWDWIAKLAEQQMQFGRGTNSPGVALSSGTRSIGVGAGGTLVPSSNPVKWIVAKDHPFMAWGQRAAIFKQAAHPAAAKLYLNWQLSAAVQSNSFNGWSVRTDVQPSGGLAPIWTYSNAHLDDFPRFMADRALAERFRQTFSLYFGEVQGAPSPGWLGLYPGR
jgi:ABC-type Fe3+ transport system substrate-binding protein